MTRAANGDRTSFDAIVRRHQHRLQRFATRMLGGNADQGADVAVGTFLRLWEARAEFQPCGQVSGWLFRTAYRLSVDVHRSQSWLELGEADAAGFGTVGEIERQELANAVREAVSSLDAPLRAVLILSAYEGLSYEQIAQALAIPVGTVGSRRNLAIRHLRKRLAAWEES